MRYDHERYMRAALEEAEKARNEGNMAVGAVIVLDEEIVACGHNETNSAHDVTSHAEVNAIRKLATRFDYVTGSMQAASGPLASAVLYATLEPCPMCCWATCISGVGRLVIGARHADLDIAFGDYSVEKLVAMSQRRIEVASGILRAECMAMCKSGPFKAGPR